jgi:hypothetical protein
VLSTQPKPLHFYERVCSLAGKHIHCGGGCAALPGVLCGDGTWCAQDQMARAGRQPREAQPALALAGGGGGGEGGGEGGGDGGKGAAVAATPPTGDANWMPAVRTVPPPCTQ